MGLERYVPRLLVSRLAAEPFCRVEVLEGTFVFIDVSGFTKLSERLAKVGKEGAELLVDAINSCFTALLADVHLLGGSLVKFGGDALLLWFDGDAHPARGCEAAVLMRRRLREVGRVTVGASTVTLRTSVGVHSGEFHSFLVGELFYDLIVGGPGSSTVVALENAADASQILISEATARQIPRRCVGERIGPGFRLARAPGVAGEVMLGDVPQLDPAVLALCLPPQVRHQVESSPDSAEHRTATVSFVELGRFDEMLERDGPERTGERLQELVAHAQAAADEQQICLVDSDVSSGSVKLRFTAGAPRVVGDDEERMLLAMRRMLAAETPFPIRIGVNRGPVFTGEIGPPYRHTYVCMGDTVNLAARLMGKSLTGTIFATEGVLDRSRTKFDNEQLEPFMVKGKKAPIQAWSVGPALRAASIPNTTTGVGTPLIGRERELDIVRDAVSRARAGAGSTIELVGDVGSGKSRLLTEVRELAPDMRFVHSTCEPYTQGIPYVLWRDPLRQLLGLAWDDTPAAVLERLRAELNESHPDLLPWLPLLSIAADGEPASSPEVDALSPEARTRVLHEAVLSFLMPALTVPTLVHIEHAHLMDAASGALLAALCDAVQSAPWLVVVTRRESAEGFVAPDDRSVTYLELGPLSRADTLRLAESTPAAHIVPPHVLELAVDRSGGSPEFLLDLLAAAQSGAAELPASIDGAAMARIDQLDPGDRTLVRRASVLGVSFHPGRVRDVLPEGADAPSLDTWSRLSSIFALDPDGHVRFKRPALHEVAYEGLPYRERRALHAALGAALERDAGDDGDAEPAVLSLHYFLAGDWERAWRHALAGAEHAAERYAHADASRLYRRALEAGRQGSASAAELAACWEALGDTLQRTGELAEAAVALNAALGLSAGEPLAQARLLHKRMVVAHMGGELAASVRRGSAAMRTIEHMDGSDARALRAQLLVELAFVRWRQGKFALSERLCRAAIEQAGDGGADRALAQASYVLDFVLLFLGRVEEAVHSTRALAIYEQLGDREQQGNVLNTMAGVAGHRWDWDEAIRLYQRAAECWRQAGDQAGVATAESNLGEILSDRGLDAEAAKTLTDALRVSNAMGEPTVAANTKALLGRVAARSGKIDEARDRLTGAAADLSRLGEANYLEFAQTALAEAEAFGGDPSVALAMVAPMLDADRRDVAWLHRVKGTALARVGRGQDAVEALETSLGVAREQGALYDVAATLDVLQLIDPHRDSAERDRLQARLGIERFHTIDLSADLQAATIRA